MEAAGEIWIEEESPIYSQMKANTSLTAVEVKLASQETVPDPAENSTPPTPVTPDRVLNPAKVVEVEVEEPPSTFSRLGQGLGLATDFIRETTKQAADELNEFKVNISSNEKSSISQLEFGFI